MRLWPNTAWRAVMRPSPPSAPATSIARLPSTANRSARGRGIPTPGCASQSCTRRRALTSGRSRRSRCIRRRIRTRSRERSPRCGSLLCAAGGRLRLRSRLLARTRTRPPSLRTSPRSSRDTTVPIRRSDFLQEAPEIDFTDPGDADALRELVIQLSAAGKRSDARARAEKALAAHPDAASFHAIRALALERGGAAAADVRAGYTRAVELDPSCALALAALGRLEDEGGNAESARSFYQRAAAADPSDVDARRRAAELAIAAGDLDDAQKRLEALLEDRPYDARAASELAALLVQRRTDLERARSLARQAVRFRGGPEAYALLVQTHLDAGKAEEAVAVLTATAERNPTDASLRYQLGRALAAAGKRDAARAAFEQALAGGDFPERNDAATALAALSAQGRGRLRERGTKAAMRSLGVDVRRARARGNGVRLGSTVRNARPGRVRRVSACVPHWRSRTRSRARRHSCRCCATSRLPELDEVEQAYRASFAGGGRGIRRSRCSAKRGRHSILRARWIGLDAGRRRRDSRRARRCFARGRGAIPTRRWSGPQGFGTTGRPSRRCSPAGRSRAIPRMWDHVAKMEPSMQRESASIAMMQARDRARGIRGAARARRGVARRSTELQARRDRHRDGARRRPRSGARARVRRSVCREPVRAGAAAQGRGSLGQARRPGGDAEPARPAGLRGPRWGTSRGRTSPGCAAIALRHWRGCPSRRPRDERFTPIVDVYAVALAKARPGTPRRRDPPRDPMGGANPGC